ncbi:hypothetical protein GCM10011490_28000 [Pseudoclavibacter endophyticus]|uniref:hypothetical protein n=1 Tax=Pseudoclavibacter endophyticus TaxID=1778590 RepID=UPI001669902A|nr:hypothetical protein [Pseudoclavibacter endophyticus]GGA75611.1 hypothetical protein GCM10011490_28000 [Pseudoclavibacter endophyticus]
MMQIGGRWAFGDTPPRGLPDELVAAIAQAEAAAPASARGGSWTLTWLEGRPVAELDSGLRVTVGDAPHGHDAALDDEDDEDLFPAHS